MPGWEGLRGWWLTGHPGEEAQVVTSSQAVGVSPSGSLSFRKFQERRQDWYALTLQKHQWV